MIAFRFGPTIAAILFGAAICGPVSSTVGADLEGNRWKGDVSFVEGTVIATDKIFEREAEIVELSPFEVSKDRISAYWYHPEGSGGIEIRITDDGLTGDFWGEGIYDTLSTFTQVGRGLNVRMDVHHEYGTARVEYLLKGVFASDAPIPGLVQREAAAPQVAAKPMPTTPTSPSPEATADSSEWERIKYSKNVSDFQHCLKRFPKGMFAVLAEQRVRGLVSQQTGPGPSGGDLAGIEFGTYHALVIGIDDYQHLRKLTTAVNDSKAVARVLEEDYGFRVTLMENPDRGDIVDALDRYRETLTYKDNLLIYYAGHGWLDEETGEGYWLSRTAKPNRRSRWVSNNTVTETMKALAAKHVMVVADSCYSGTLTRAASVGFRDKGFLRRMASKMARVALVSGGLEPVADEGAAGNSPFSRAFLDALKANDGIIDGTQLFSEIRRLVILSASQTPQYSDVGDAGHDGGDFLFVRKK